MSLDDVGLERVEHEREDIGASSMIFECHRAGLELGDETKMHGIPWRIQRLGQGGSGAGFFIHTRSHRLELLPLLLVEHAVLLVMVLLIAATTTPDQPSHPPPLFLLALASVPVATVIESYFFGCEPLFAEVVPRYGTIEADILVAQLLFQLFQPRAAVALCDGKLRLVLVRLLDAPFLFV